MVQSSGVDLGVIEVKRDTTTTIYKQLYEQLKAFINRGDLPSGRRLPSSRQLAEEIGVSRMTVREVYDQLLTEGYLNSIIGSGTFVSDFKGSLNLPIGQAIASNKKPGFRSREETVLSTRSRDFLSIPLGDISPNPLPFNPAIPDFDLFPFLKWNRIVKRTLASQTYAAMDYGQAGGFPPLKQALAESISLSRGVNCEPDQIVIVTSSEQAIRQLVFLLLDPKHYAWFGEPGVYNRRNAFRTTGIQTRTVPVDEEGVIVESAYSFGKRAKLAYVMPWRHYPLGITMSLSRRFELLQWAQDNNAWILEDDMASEFCFAGKAPPPIHSLDVEDRVIYMGGFGLTLFPSLRLSYIVLPKALVNATRQISLAERSVSTVLQPALAEFIADGHLTSQIRKMRKVYRRREKFLYEFLSAEIGHEITISGRGGGTNIMLNLPSHVHEIELADVLKKAQIIAHPLTDYFLNKKPASDSSNALNLGFACASREKLRESALTLIDRYHRLCDSGNKNP